MPGTIWGLFSAYYVFHISSFLKNLAKRTESKIQKLGVIWIGKKKTLTSLL